MRKTITTLAVASLALPFAWACASDGTSGPSASAPGGSTTATAPAASTSGGASAATSSGANTGTTAPASSGSGTSGIPSLVNVNLQNVLNDLAIKLNIDRANVPINIQLPIQLAANVCGVSVNVLSVSTGGKGTCEAKTAPQELAQVVQQQMAAGGSVGGGAQGGSTAATAGTASSGAATGGSADTSATSSGARQ